MDGVIDMLLALTGLGLVRVLSIGKWRGEKLRGNEAAINSAAGSLSYVVKGKRVVSIQGLTLVGLAFYGALAGVAICLAARG
ncbi:MAG: hypothetical protein EON54_03585 [Alcaligenaceae bacterium]|nr:MAG: hypothetical protein EON54_03585 [Alcaligenaceae bacterium]